MTTTIKPFSLDVIHTQEKPWQPYHLIHSGPTPVCKKMSCHFSGLLPGQVPHPPHIHRDEEILIVLEGQATIITEKEGSEQVTLSPGDFVYYPPFFYHTIQNNSQQPLAYLMFKWITGKQNPKGALPKTVFQYDRDIPTPKPFNTMHLCNHRTVGLKKLNSHLTVLLPKGGYRPHADPYDVGIVLLEGTVRTLGQDVTSPAVIYYNQGDDHGMKNIGTSPARYLVFEFHNG